MILHRVEIVFYLLDDIYYVNNKSKKNTMKRIVRLTESDLIRLVKRVIKENNLVGSASCVESVIKEVMKKNGINVDVSTLPSCKKLLDSTMNVQGKNGGDIMACATEIAQELPFTQLMTKGPEITSELLKKVQDCLGGSMKY